MSADGEEEELSSCSYVFRSLVSDIPLSLDDAGQAASITCVECSGKLFVEMWYYAITR